jgi:hypothetical protein
MSATWSCRSHPDAEFGDMPFTCSVCGSPAEPDDDESGAAGGASESEFAAVLGLGQRSPAVSMLGAIGLA